ncbi:MAG: peptide deformylase [Myxococcales bacterium]|nr:peptide deformylase [Myxococcales bacterium]
MTLLKIAHVGHPVLRDRSRELTRDELASAAVQRFIDDLVETMRDASGAGLAAPQVHNPIRVCALEVTANPRYPYLPEIPLTILVNPVVASLGEETFESYEGCLSVPNLRGVVRRNTDIELTYWDRDGAQHKERVGGLAACVYQHEIDHLDGKLFLDRVEDTRTLTTWTEFERFHRQAYLEKILPLVPRMGG